MLQWRLSSIFPNLNFDLDVYTLIYTQRNQAQNKIENNADVKYYRTPAGWIKSLKMKMVTHLLDRFLIGGLLAQKVDLNATNCTLETSSTSHTSH